MRVLGKLYWIVHTLAAWLVGIALVTAGVLMIDLSGAAYWPLAAGGIGVILLGESSRRHRKQPAAPGTADPR